MVFFIPRFQTPFEGLSRLPLLTQVIVGTSGILRSYGLFVAVGVFLWFISPDSGSGAKRGVELEKALMQAPIVGPLMAKFAMARFCRMGTLCKPMCRSSTVFRLRGVRLATKYC